MKIRRYIMANALHYGISVYVDAYGSLRDEVTVSKEKGMPAFVCAAATGPGDPASLREYAAAVLKACEIAEALDAGKEPEL